ncbi:hypothetical protein [Erythrobacter donghaensis]|uniref:hypothetical protein n=1 Tax=Erythrobacter donghaensis TaxID=267135 RepID=UPI000AD871CC|nr:hypothetical protein [Erythrobacter donghaensis]
MATTKSGTEVTNPPEQSLEAQLAAEPTISNAVKQMGLGEIASTVRGEGFVVCDLNTHGVQGCADIRSAADNQKLAAELVALGLVIFAAVLVGSIAVTFVKLVTRLAHPVGEHRVYALFPRRRAPVVKDAAPWKA